ncbi:MAG: imidazole glycerol phosphate synthase subunit HisH [Bdellovibrionota bacterium]
MSAAPKVGIVDYGVGNLFSVVEACKVAALEPTLVTSPDGLAASDGIILPGVGAFGTAVEHLQNLGLFSALQEAARAGRPLLGICLGMQLLFDSSSEFGDHRGLGLIPGTVRELREMEPKDPRLKVPHIGWTPVTYRTPEAWPTENPALAALFADIPDNTEYYFVHSFAAEPKEPSSVAAESDYLGRRFCSVAHSKNVIGMQCHPERSGTLGLKVYRNWGELLRRQKGLR